jgi:ferrochelatase
VCIVPVAFVTEHVETLNEIDIQYREIAKAASIPEFQRACAVKCHPSYIRCLADLAQRVAASLSTEVASARA